MVGKKNIEDAFKEGLDNLQKSPPDIVWENIAASLDKKEKRKVLIPLWIKLSGAAIFLILGIIYLNNLNSNSTEEEYTVQSDYVNSSKQKTKEYPKKSNSNTQQTNLNHIICKDDNFNPIKKSKNIAQISKYTHSKTQQKITIAKTKKIEEQKIELKKYVLALEKIISKNYLKFTFAKIPPINDPIDLPIENKDADRRTKWNIALKGSPVYYSSLKRGSSLNPEYTNNKKNSKPSTSYGVQASFYFKERVGLRTGINLINLAYNTKKTTKESTISSSIALNESALESFDSLSYSVSIEESIFSLTQKIQYIEIPLELSFNLINNKFKADIVGGLSGLVLIDDFILRDNQKEIGKATNLAKISYTGNLGIGVQYKITKYLNLSIEPTVKLQFATYSNNANFKPYYFGVYSGFYYSF